MLLLVYFAAFVGMGYVVGWLIGRWWALFGAVAIGVLITRSDPGWEIPDWLFGVVYGGLLGIGIVVGVVRRKRSDRALLERV